MRRSLEGYLKLPNPKALAIIGGDNNMLGVEDFDSEPSAVRATVERCSYFFQQPCLLFAIDDNLVVRVPASRRVRDAFILSSDQQMSSADRQRIAEVYRGGEWRALARGKSGWYPVANAASEADAIAAASRACAERDTECRLYAIGNFRVTDESLP